MVTPQQVLEAFAKGDLDTMMEAVRIVASRLPQPLVVESSAVYAAAILHELGSKTREEFWATSLDAGGTIIMTHPMYVGTSHTAAIRPVEIMKLMIADDATAFIVAHNHPGEQKKITPSPADVDATQHLFKIARFMGLPLIDHIIVSKGQWFSFLEHDLLEEKNVRKSNAQRAPNGARPASAGSEQSQDGQSQMGRVRPK